MLVIEEHLNRFAKWKTEKIWLTVVIFVASVRLHFLEKFLLYVSSDSDPAQHLDETDFSSVALMDAAASLA